MEEASGQHVEERSWERRIGGPRTIGTTRRREAKIARRRLLPVSCVYSVFALSVLLLVFFSEHPLAGVFFFLFGVVVWTPAEYAFHRYILHGSFPDGDGVRHWLHKYFDHLHWEHHERPWDGKHISGTVGDTFAFFSIVALLSFLAPIYTAPAFVAGFLQAYIVEEWIHYSVHFHNFQNRYFRHIQRHHRYHHSPRGSDVGYGLSNPFWDVIWKTRIPENVRRVLYGRETQSRVRSKSFSKRVDPLPE